MNSKTEWSLASDKKPLVSQDDLLRALRASLAMLTALACPLRSEGLSKAEGPLHRVMVRDNSKGFEKIGTEGAVVDS